MNYWLRLDADDILVSTLNFEKESILIKLCTWQMNMSSPIFPFTRSRAYSDSMHRAECVSHIPHVYTVLLKQEQYQHIDQKMLHSE